MTTTMWILSYLLLINLVGFFAMGIDKKKAIKRAWRIPESTLFLIAIVGGSIGSIIGMHVFHHKTKHWYFLWGMPIILILQVVAFVLIQSIPGLSITIM